MEGLDPPDIGPNRRLVYRRPIQNDDPPDPEDPPDAGNGPDPGNPVPGQGNVLPIPIFTCAPIDVPAMTGRSRPFTDAEMIEIVSMNAREASATEIAAKIGRTSSGVRKFLKRMERTGQFRAKRGRPAKFGLEEQGQVVDQVLQDRQLSVRRAAAAPESQPGREWIRRARHKQGFHFYSTMPVPPSVYIDLLLS
jgi:transposase